MFLRIESQRGSTLVQLGPLEQPPGALRTLPELVHGIRYGSMNRAEFPAVKFFHTNARFACAPSAFHPYQK